MADEQAPALAARRPHRRGAPLVAAFEAAHPEYTGRIYRETIFPGLPVEQIGGGGTGTGGNMTWTARPGACFVGYVKIKQLLADGVPAGHPIAHVDIPGAVVQGAAHPAAARAWLPFLRSLPSLAIFARYGFKPYAPTN